MVEEHIMQHGAYEVARHISHTEYTRSLVRQSNTTDDKILSLIELNNEEAKQESSQPNPINSTQRDMAGASQPLLAKKKEREEERKIIMLLNKDMLNYIFIIIIIIILLLLFAIEECARNLFCAG